jgi:DNA/RNA endonuclease G (NUC1)
VASGVTYPGNAEFGEPVDADASDDFIVHHEQFTASYSPTRGGPNWVSYDLDAEHFGAEDRCDCFTMDPDLPVTFPRITTDDYTGATAAAGYGIDRGHMTRSFDRTTGSLDNARTYLFSNVVPQAADMNQGPWANLENDLGDLARLQGREVYIITGPAGNKGTLKDLGRVVIPTSTWKVAVIMPHDLGLADVHDYRDLEVIAVNMPNEPGVRNVDWNTYRTTVDAIEALTGYDLLALLPDDAEEAVESNTQPPFAAIAGPAGAIAEGTSATFDASSSIDPNGSIASYAWDFGDGSTGSGVSVSHTFAQDGAFTVRVTVTDIDGLSDSATFVLNVTNVAPVVATVPGPRQSTGAMVVPPKWCH